MGAFLEEAAHHLSRIKRLASQSGYRCLDIPFEGFGVGADIGFSETEFVVLSVMGGAGSTLYISSGVLRDIQEDRLAALEACNGATRGTPAFPCFLADGPLGWDVIMQQAHPVELLLEAPAYFRLCVEQMPVVTEKARTSLAATDLGGVPFCWNDEDTRRLLARSL